MGLEQNKPFHFIRLDKWAQHHSNNRFQSEGGAIRFRDLFFNYLGMAFFNLYKSLSNI